MHACRCLFLISPFCCYSLFDIKKFHRNCTLRIFLKIDIFTIKNKVEWRRVGILPMNNEKIKSSFCLSTLYLLVDAECWQC